jgi:hypothetical protein
MHSKDLPSAEDENELLVAEGTFEAKVEKVRVI